MVNPYARYIENFFSDSLCRAINQVADTNSTVREALNEFEDRTVRIEITNFGYSYTLTADDGVLLRDETAVDEPDLTVSGKFEDFLKVLASRNFSMAEVKDIDIAGDMKLAQRLFRIFSTVEFDWEEEIAKRVGDIPARRIGNFVRWGKNSVIGSESRLAKKVRSFVTEQTHMIPSRSRVEKFMDDVDTLKADVDRMGKRVQRLKDKD